MTNVASLPMNDWVGAWTVDSARSTATFRCRTMWGLATVKGTFSDLSGACEVTGTGEQASGDLRIGAASVATGIRKRDEHLRSPDFFDVVHFPAIAVAVTSVTPNGKDAAGLGATLTIKSTTHPINPQATVTALKDGAVRVTAEVVINRHDFGVDGDLLGMITDDARISADVVFVRSSRT